MKAYRNTTALACGLAIYASVAQASPEALTIKISSQPMVDAVHALSVESDLPILAPRQLLIGLQSQPVDGKMSAYEALGRMLEGTGLAVIEVSDGSLVVRPHLSFTDVTQGALDIGTIVLDSDLPPSQDPTDGYRASQATTTTRVKLPIQKTPGTVNVVTNDSLRDRAARKTSDALETVANVNRENVIGGRSESFTIRGFEAAVGFDDRDLSTISENGLPSNLLFSPDPAIIERYEVAKGPSSITSGLGSPGGLINRVIKRPEDDDFYDFSLAVGSFDYARAVADANWRLGSDGNARARLIIAGDQDGNFIAGTGAEQYTIAPSVEFDVFGGSGTLLLQARFQEYDGTPQMGIPLFPDGSVPNVSPTINFGGAGSNGSSTEFSDTSFYAEYEHRFDNDLIWTTKLSYSDSDFDNLRIFGFSPGGLAPNGDSGVLAQQREVFRETFAAETYVSREFEFSGLPSEFLIGTSYLNIDTDAQLNTLFFPGTDNIFAPTNPFSIDRVTLRAMTTDVTRDSDYEQYSIFGQLVTEPLDGLTLVFAGRYDWADTTFVNVGTPTNGNLDDFTGRLGASYEFLPNTNVFAGYQESFDPQPTATTISGEIIGPETGWSAEIGVKREFAQRRAFWSLAAFHIVRENLAQGDPLNPGFSIRVGEQTSQGVEFELAGELAPGWNVTSGIGYVEGEITEDVNPANIGRDIRGLRNWSVGLFTTYDFQSGPLKDFGIGMGVRHLSDVTYSEGVSANGFTRVDAVAYYRPSENLSIQLNIGNLFDETYIESGTALSNGNNFGAPRNATLTANFRF